MADQKISAATSAGALDGTEIVPVVKSGNKRTTVAAIKNYEEPYTALSGTTWDLTTGRKKTKTISSNTALLLSNVGSGKGLGMIVITQSGGPFTLTINGASIPLNDEGPTWICFSDYGSGNIVFSSNAGTTEPATPPDWEYISLAVSPAPVLMTDTSHVFQALSGSGWGAYATANESFIGDMYLIAQIGSGAQEFIIGLKTSSTLGDFTGYSVGFAVTGGGLYEIITGSSGSLSYSPSAGEWVGIRRTASAFEIIVSMDKATWTVKHTSSFTSAADLHIFPNLYAQSPLGRVHNIQTKAA